MNIAVFVSGGGTNLQALLDQKANGSLKKAKFVQVIASRPGTRAEDRARSAGIPAAVVSRKSFANQEEYDRIVLAGFLTRLGPLFLQRYKGRIINIHPSLLPSFGGPGFYGLKPHEAVLEYGCRVSGATVHFVDESYDHGAIILQKAVAVELGDTPELLQLRVMLEAEQVILPQAVDLFTRGLIRILENGKVNILEDIHDYESFDQRI